jgi:hypothetical protein
MTPSELILALSCATDESIPIEQKLPVHIWGEPGVGKSDIVRELAAGMGIGSIDLRAVLLDPVDLRGLPVVTGDTTRWLPPSFLPSEGQGILFLDELTSAPAMVQAACYQLVLDRKLGEYSLPEGWVIMAAGNPPSSRGVHFAMPEPLKNRFFHVFLEPNLKEWCFWAVTHGVSPKVIAFLRFRPELLLEGQQERLQRGKDENDNAWATPRSWAMLSRLLGAWERRFPNKSGINNPTLLLQMFEGLVGKAVAPEFFSFLKLCEELPSIDEILLSPKTAPIPDDPSAAIAIATAIGHVMSPQNIAPCDEYLRGLGKRSTTPEEVRCPHCRQLERRGRRVD